MYVLRFTYLSVGLMKLVDAALVKISLRQSPRFQMFEASLNQLRLGLWCCREHRVMRRPMYTRLNTAFAMLGEDCSLRHMCRRSSSRCYYNFATCVPRRTKYPNVLDDTTRGLQYIEKRVDHPRYGRVQVQ